MTTILKKKQERSENNDSQKVHKETDFANGIERDVHADILEHLGRLENIHLKQMPSQRQ